MYFLNLIQPEVYISESSESEIDSWIARQEINSFTPSSPQENGGDAQSHFHFQSVDLMLIVDLISELIEFILSLALLFKSQKKM